MLAFFVALAGAESSESADTYWQLWTEFRASPDRFMAPSNDLDEHNQRFLTFKNNIDKINEHNAGDHSWVMGITPFTDMTPEQFKDMVITHTCDHGFQERAKANLARTRLEDGEEYADERRRKVDLSAPTTVDWRSNNRVSRVKNQGGCGSCWAFSTTGAIEARYAIAKNTSPVELSEQELVDCAKDYQGRPMDCANGGIMQRGFEYSISHRGICKEDAYPYTARDGTCKSSSCQHVDPISSYKDIRVSESSLEAAVAQGPVAVAIQADQSAFQLYRGGVFNGNCGTQLDHGVLIVGYQNTGSPYWVMKNSWGTGWGESGYMKMCKNCGKNGSKGQCGVAMDASYPVV